MNDTSPGAVDALEQALRTATERLRPDALLLSGGLDSSLLAAMWAKAGHRFKAITVGISPSTICGTHRDLPYPCNSDIAWAEKVAKALDLDWEPVVLPEHEALEALDWLLMQQRSFDLGQLNNIALIAGIQAARKHGAATIATGDDADGLFGGYRFLRTNEQWSEYVTRRIPNIDPPVRGIARSAQCSPMLPYLEPEILAVASQRDYDEVYQRRPVSEHPLPPSFVDQYDSEMMEAHSRLWGKVVLRHVAERWLPETDLQFGSGMCALESPLARSLNRSDVMNLDTTGIQWFNDAHRGVYVRFRRLGLTVPAPQAGEYACRSCSAGVPIGRKHCVTCGCWPADELPATTPV